MSNFPSRSTHALRRLFVACAMLGLAASAQAATTLETVKQNSSIRIGYANETPFAFTETDGRVTGESPEIAKAIFAKMGIKQVDGVFYFWGHSYEIVTEADWQAFEQNIARLSAQSATWVNLPDLFEQPAGA